MDSYSRTDVRLPFIKAHTKIKEWSNFQSEETKSNEREKHVDADISFHVQATTKKQGEVSLTGKERERELNRMCPGRGYLPPL